MSARRNLTIDVLVRRLHLSKIHLNWALGDFRCEFDSTKDLQFFRHLLGHVSRDVQSLIGWCQVNANSDEGIPLFLKKLEVLRKAAIELDTTLNQAVSEASMQQALRLSNAFLQLMVHYLQSLIDDAFVLLSCLEENE